LLQAIGYGVTVVGFVLQVPARLACDRLSGVPRLIVADLYQFLCFCGTVNLWRGVWNLLNIYFLPGEYFFKFLFFMLSNLSHTSAITTAPGKLVLFFIKMINDITINIFCSKLFWSAFCLFLKFQKSIKNFVWYKISKEVVNIFLLINYCIALLR